MGRRRVENENIHTEREGYYGGTYIRREKRLLGEINQKVLNQVNDGRIGLRRDRVG